MTKEEIAAEIVSTPLEAMPELVDVIFAAFEDTYNEQGLKDVFDILYQCGVDVRPICKKKHPL